MFILAFMTFSGCVGKEIENNTITSVYNKYIEAIIIENNVDNNIYVDYDIILLDKESKVLYKNEYRKKSLRGEEQLYINLEDIKPDYMEYETIEKMDIVLKSVNKNNTSLVSNICIVIFIALIINLALMVEYGY